MPQKSEFPYLTLGQSSQRDWSTGTEPGTEHLLTLHVWSRARGRREARDIIAALELALHCDFIYSTATTKFGDTHTPFGLRPTWGMSQTLAQAVGIRKAKELSYTARVFSGDEAMRLCLANESVAGQEELDELVTTRVAQIANNSRAAVAAMKDLYRLSQQGESMEEALVKELGTEYEDILDTAERLAAFR